MNYSDFSVNFVLVLKRF